MDEDATQERIYYVNRTVCDILTDMRDTIKAGKAVLDFNVPDVKVSLEYSSWQAVCGSFLILAAQVEELQWTANRMEANLQDVKDVRELLEERSKLKAEVFKLRKEKKQLLVDKLQDSEEN